MFQFFSLTFQVILLVAFYLSMGYTLSRGDSWELWRAMKPSNSPWRRLMRNFQRRSPRLFRTLIQWFWPPFLAVGLVFMFVDVPVTLVYMATGHDLAAND